MIELSTRYVPDGTVGTGGHGSVYFCNDQNLNRKVAIKVIRDRTQQRRIFDEVKALLQMRSKHVVQVYDITVARDGEVGIVQEYVDGQDLFDSELPRKSSDDYLKSLWQIASGIADIHAAGLIHRDIKPNNMKVSEEGIIKIFDFGLAREEGLAAQTIGFVGTHGFAAPEQYLGGQFTQAVDKYQFGATALFIATSTETPELFATPPRPLSVNPFLSFPNGIEVPKTVADLLLACLAHNPEDRPELSIVRDTLAKHLLFKKHQALAVHRGKPSYLNADNSAVDLEMEGIGLIQIQYDGLKFFVSGVSGEVVINNRIAEIGQELPGSCVVALGYASRKANRAYITFDLANPEVIL